MRATIKPEFEKLELKMRDSPKAAIQHNSNSLIIKDNNPKNFEFKEHKFESRNSPKAAIHHSLTSLITKNNNVASGIISAPSLNPSIKKVFSSKELDSNIN